MKLLVINGPNLNMLGVREPGIYGAESYESLVNMIQDKARSKWAEVECFQSNHEGAIIDRLHLAMSDGTAGIIINPGAYTHYSYAIYDALKMISMPKIEVHISDIDSREDFRKVSVTAPACDEQIIGHGLLGYVEAVEKIIEKLEKIV
ncbi:MAG: type II 3-dehydroquinate dehydratase [Lachnospiraceae bacterium]|nr:type II 3-dehydroquinate dehydratase [Lachnospiraceae bacterium]